MGQADERHVAFMDAFKVQFPQLGRSCTFTDNGVRVVLDTLLPQADLDHMGDMAASHGLGLNVRMDLGDGDARVMYEREPPD